MSRPSPGHPNRQPAPPLTNPPQQRLGRPRSLQHRSPPQALRWRRCPAARRLPLPCLLRQQLVCRQHMSRRPRQQLPPPLSALHSSGRRRHRRCRRRLLPLSPRALQARLAPPACHPRRPCRLPRRSQQQQERRIWMWIWIRKSLSLPRPPCARRSRPRRPRQCSRRRAPSGRCRRQCSLCRGRSCRGRKVLPQRPLRRGRGSKRRRRHRQQHQRQQARVGSRLRSRTGRTARRGSQPRRRRLRCRPGRSTAPGSLRSSQRQGPLCPGSTRQRRPPRQPLLLLHQRRLWLSRPGGLSP